MWQALLDKMQRPLEAMQPTVRLRPGLKPLLSLRGPHFRFGLTPRDLHALKAQVAVCGRRTRGNLSGQKRRVSLAAAVDGGGQLSTANEKKITQQFEEQGIPTPIIKIDNKSDNFSTVVSLEFGDQLGELLDTVRSLKNLNLNIRRAKIRPGDSGRVHKFYVTDAHTAEKITKSARLEEIRMSILQNLLFYHPESASELGFGPKARKPSSRDSLHPLGPRNRSEIKTNIKVQEDPNGAYTEVIVKTTDRPGLLTDIVHNMKDININVISAEVDTEGPMAIDQFYVTYHGEPLPGPMVLLLKNSLQYQLSLAEVGKEESY